MRVLILTPDVSAADALSRAAKEKQLDVEVIDSNTCYLILANGEMLQKINDYEAAFELISALTHLSSNEKEIEAAEKTQNADAESVAQPQDEQSECEVKDEEDTVEEVAASPDEEAQNENKKEQEIGVTISVAVIKNFNDDKEIPTKTNSSSEYSTLGATDIEVADSYVKFRFDNMIYKFMKAETKDQLAFIKVDLIVNGETIKDVKIAVTSNPDNAYELTLGSDVINRITLDKSKTE